MRETKRLFLKEYDPKYNNQAHENFFSSKETSKYVLWRPTSSEQEVKDKIEYWLYECNVKIFWMVHDKQSDEPIGFVSADELEENIYGNVGIALGEKYVGKGYGSEILEELIRYIKLQGGTQIQYSHFKENEASRALALKYGFKYYKSHKRLRRHDNKEFEEVFYVLKLK